MFGVLVDWEIFQLCEKGLITPFNSEHINPSSLDICVGESAMVDTVTGFEFDHNFNNCSKDNPYYMQPHECLLVSSLESVNIPPHISAELKLKSSRAREGLGHALAGWIDPGFHGILTLELKNYSTKHNIPIYPGLRVAQLILHTTSVPKKTYANGRYAGKTTVLHSLDL